MFDEVQTDFLNDQLKVEREKGGGGEGEGEGVRVGVREREGGREGGGAVGS